MAKRPYRDDFDQGEFSRDILDIIPERYDYDEDSQEARSGSRFRTVITLVVAVAAIGGIVAAGWKLVGGRHGLATGAGVPEIKAESQPIKVRPEDRGGMQVPNQDKLVYRSMEQEGEVQGDNPAPKTERLLAPPEEPKPPTRPDAVISGLPDRDAPPPPQGGALPQVSQAPLAPPAQTASSQPSSPQPERAAAPDTAPKFSEVMKEPDTPAKHAAPKTAAPKTALPRAPERKETEEQAKPAPKKAVSLASGDYVVQLGAVRSADAADKEWSRILHANNDLLSGLSSDIVQVDLPGKGTFWRVRAGALSDQAARQLCQQLSERNQGCIVARK